MKIQKWNSATFQKLKQDKSNAEKKLKQNWGATIIIILTILMKKLGPRLRPWTNNQTLISIYVLFFFSIKATNNRNLKQS
jgi:vacuolar-type H+-ATPase subunit F/Vma7